jgi:hypothetical protein
MNDEQLMKDALGLIEKQRSDIAKLSDERDKLLRLANELNDRLDALEATAGISKAGGPTPNVRDAIQKSLERRQGGLGTFQPVSDATAAKLTKARDARNEASKLERAEALASIRSKRRI